MPLEQEVKLEFASVGAARRAIELAGGRLVVSSRLLVDALFDTPGTDLRSSGRTLRIRRDGHRAILTFKGPGTPGPVKSREEIESVVDNFDVVESILKGLGYTRWFLGEKLREEYELDDALVTVDETPIGTFVEIESTPEGIERVARRLGRSPADYRLESYPRLYAQWCKANGREFGDMRFPE